MSKIYWAVFGGVLLFLAAILTFIFWSAAPKSVRQAAGQLTHKEQRTATAARDQELKTADQKRKAADRATANAEILIKEGDNTAAQAAALRLKSHTRHASPPLTSDSAIRRLERRWADWRP